MKLINGTAIFVLWLREMKRFVRAKSRLIGTLALPLFFLVFMGLGFTRMSIPGMPENMDYVQFLVPGIIGMTMLFTSMLGGISVLWDKQFGFLKEVMVAPVSRVSIVLGRTIGGATTALIQGILILVISLFIGFKIAGILPFLLAMLLAILFMILTSATFIGLGLIFASRMKDIHGFGLITNLITFPLFLLSGALFPLKNFPSWVRSISYADPLTYGVDGLRGTLLGVSSLPIITNLIIIAGFSLVMVFLGAYFFEKSEAV